MNHIQPLGWLDTTLMLANFRLRHYDGMETAEIPRFALMLEGREHPVLTKFASARGVLHRLANEAAVLTGGATLTLTDAYIELMLPNSQTAWSQDDDTEHLMLQCALTNPPGAWLYCGGDAVQLAVGVVNYVNVAAMHCAANFSDSPRIHLVARVERPAAD